MNVFFFKLTDNEIVVQKIIFGVEIVGRLLPFDKHALKANFLGFKKACAFDDLEEV